MTKVNIKDLSVEEFKKMFPSNGDAPLYSEPIQEEDKSERRAKRSAANFPQEFRYNNVESIPVESQMYPTCVAMALSTIVKIMEVKYDKDCDRGDKFSNVWIYGNRQGMRWITEGMGYREAVAKLVNDGVPKRSEIISIDSALDGEYPYIKETNIITTAKDIVARNYNKVLSIAKRHRPTSYNSISRSADSIKRALIEDSPVMFCTTTANAQYAMFIDKNHCLNGSHNAGEVHDGTTLPDGGHAVVIYGWKYINGEEYFICRNSWGEGAGDHGDFYISSKIISSVSTEIYSMKFPIPPIPPKKVTGLITGIKLGELLLDDEHWGE